MPKILEGICAELSFPWVSQFSFFFFPFFFWSWRQAETEAGVQEHEQQYLLATTGTQAGKQSAKVEECRPAVMGVEIQWRQTKKEKKRKAVDDLFPFLFFPFRSVHELVL